MSHHLALVMLFEGETPSAQTLLKVGTVLKQEANVVGNIDTMVVNSKEIVTSILQKKEVVESLNPNLVNISIVDRKYTPEENAAILVGERMEKYLGSDFTKDTFVVGLVNKTMYARKHPNDQINKAFLHAILILSQPDLHISPEVLIKSKLDVERIAIIRDTYNFLSHE